MHNGFFKKVLIHHKVVSVKLWHIIIPTPTDNATWGNKNTTLRSLYFRSFQSSSYITLNKNSKCTCATISSEHKIGNLQKFIWLTTTNIKVFHNTISSTYVIIHFIDTYTKCYRKVLNNLHLHMILMLHYNIDSWS